MAKVLVTGAAGQVGSRLVRQLLAKGYQVKGLILPDDPNQERLADLDVEIVEGNLLDPDVAVTAVADADAVVHTANLTAPLPDMSESDFFANNVMATFHVARAASRRAGDLERLVHVSSSSVYPNDTQTISACYHPVDEDHPQRPRGTYPLSKLVGEDIVWAHVRQTALRAAIVRPSGICSGDAVLGRWTVGFVASLLKAGQASPQSDLHMADGTELWHELEQAAASPDQPCAVTDDEGRPWVYQLVDARDVAHGCICALESDAAVGEAFNLAAPRPIPFPGAAALLSEALGVPVLEWRLPVRWQFDLDITKAKSLIGYAPRWDIEPMIHSALAYRRGEPEEM